LPSVWHGLVNQNWQMSETCNGLEFQGFEAPQENWCKLPHALIDVLPVFESKSELAVVLYVLRHTWGFQEFEAAKRITYDEFQYGRKRRDGTRIDGGTGLSRASVALGLKQALEHGFLEAETDAGDAARVKKFYRLRMLPDLNSEANDGIESEPQEFRNRTTAVQKLNHSGSETEPRSEKDTLERNLGKEKNGKEESFSAYLKMPAPQSPREQLQRDLAWLLEAEVPDDPHRYKPWEKATDSIAADVRKALDKQLFDEECAMLVHRAIERLAGRRNEYPLKNATSPTIPVIELILREARAPQGDTRAPQGVVMRTISGWTAPDLNDPEIKKWKEKRDANR